MQKNMRQLDNYTSYSQETDLYISCRIRNRIRIRNTLNNHFGSITMIREQHWEKKHNTNVLLFVFYKFLRLTAIFFLPVLVPASSTWWMISDPHLHKDNKNDKKTSKIFANLHSWTQKSNVPVKKFFDGSDQTGGDYTKLKSRQNQSFRIF